MLVYWEATQACDLACIHCRANAKPSHHPLQLNTDEAASLMRQVAGFGERPPHVVITGGDPLRRPDLYDLVSYGKTLGLQFSVTPAGTARLTVEVVRKLKDLGVASVALSLDGSTAERHDAFRSVDGSFEWTMNGVGQALSLGMDVQINTMVTAMTLLDLPEIYQLLSPLKLARWALFFLIPTGRGSAIKEITSVESENLLNWLLNLQEKEESGFAIKTTEAHHYRRIAIQRYSARNEGERPVLRSEIMRGFGIRDGNGIVFVSHLGAVYPSGFLPIATGNVRVQNLIDLYRDHDLFKSLRDPNQFSGKCGICPFNTICGGSRARAYATSGDPFESDPLCIYQPKPN